MLFVPLLLAFLSVRKSKRLTDWLLLTTVFIIGQQIAPSPPATALPGNAVYRINSRCEEVLPRHHYILSVGPQLFYLNNHYTDTLYRPGDSLHFHARIVPFHEQANPGEFSYARYLRQKKVYSQLIPKTAVTQKGRSNDLGSFFLPPARKINGQDLPVDAGHHLPPIDECPLPGV